jgi:hypothetical protein
MAEITPRDRARDSVGLTAEVLGPIITFRPQCMTHSLDTCFLRQSGTKWLGVAGEDTPNSSGTPLDSIRLLSHLSWDTLMLTLTVKGTYS